MYYTWLPEIKTSEIKKLIFLKPFLFNFKNEIIKVIFLKLKSLNLKWHFLFHFENEIKNVIFLK